MQDLRPRRHVDLVDHADGVAGEQAGDEAVTFSHWCGGVDNEKAHVDTAEGQGGAVVEPLAEQGAGLVDSRRVNEDHLGVGPGEHAAHRRPGGLGHLRGDGHLLTEDGVEQGGLADVGPADQGGEARPHGSASRPARPRAPRARPPGRGPSRRRDADPADAPSLHPLGDQAVPVDEGRLTLDRHVSEQAVEQAADGVPFVALGKFGWLRAAR